MASGVNATARQVGLAAGIAVLGAVLATRTREAASARAGFTAGLNEILIIGAIVAFAAALLSAALIRQRDFVPPQRATDGPQAGQAVPEGTAQAG
jgi:hypothetical protein